MAPRTLLGFLFAALVAAACGKDGDTPSHASDDVNAAEPCTAASQCTECGSCFDLCRCAGASAAECTDECAPGDAVPPPPPVHQNDGRRSVTVVTQEFEVGPGEETFRCQNFSNPFGEDVVVLKSNSVMPQGSHHMFVFTRDDVGASNLEVCGGLEFGPNIHGSQRSTEELAYPEGVGRFLSGTQGLRVQAHYLNTTDEPIQAYVAVTLEVVAPDEVEQLASHVFINTLAISILPQSTGTATKTCAAPRPVKMLSASSHMHQYGVQFAARASDGQLVYETNEWAEPEPWRFSPELELDTGESITTRCDYNNTSSYHLGFGESAATNEMCILSGVYYPAPPDGAGYECIF